MRESEDVPTSFFENMVGLRVLNLSNLSDPYLPRPSLSLPKWIQLLMNIRSLLVDNVILGDISVLGTMQSLETLEFHGCEIGEFSREIAKLKKLRLLRLKICEIISNNPFEVIQRCPSIEELYFLGSFNDFCREITLPTTLQRYHLIDQIYTTNEQTSKHVCLEKNDNYFSDATYKYLMQTSDHFELKINKGWKNLMPEIVPIDEGMNDLIELQLSDSSQLQCLVDTEHINSQVPPIVFSELVVLKLKKMKNLEELCKGPISFDSMNNLRYVKLKSCSRLVSIFELSTSQNLPLLEKLKIIRCENLENIITFANGYNDNKSCYSLFPKLKVLKIEECHQLEFLLPILSAQDLPFLEVIKIISCHKLKYIFGQHQEVQFTSLKRVRIEDLPNFVNIFPRNASSSSKDGSKPQIQPDPVKGNIFSKKIPLVSEDQPQDCSISLESNSCCLNIWERAQCLSRQSHILCNNIKEIGLYDFSKIKSVFILSIAPRGLESLTIKSCDELKQIIIDTGDHNSTGGNSLSIVFPKLKKLDVMICKKLEYVIGHYNDDHENHTEIQPHLPPMAIKSMDGTIIKELSGNEESGQQMNLSLEDIELCNLPVMTCLFVGLKNSFVLKNLRKMNIFRCEKIETVFPTSVLRCLPQLVSLIIKECKELKHIIENDLEDKKFQSSNTCFPKLQNLVVEKCHKLKCIFKVSICREFPELKVMMIREANELEEIFKSELGDKKNEIEEISKSEVEIPNLKVVAFVNLPSLGHAQGVPFQAVKYRFVDGCQKLSLTSASSYTFEDDLFDLCRDNYLYWDMKILFEQLQEELECHNTGKENPSAETTKDFADGIEVQATPEHHLTSPQELMDQPCLMNQQHPLEEIDSTIKPSQEYNLEGSTSEITAATTLSTITETNNKPPTLAVPKQKGIEINVEEETTSTNAKTITSSTHLDAAGSSSGQFTSECKTSSQEDGDSQIAQTSFSISTTKTNDQGSLNDDYKGDDITVSKSEPSPSITSPVAYQFPSVPCKEDPSQKVEDLSSFLLVKSELQQLVSKNNLDCGNLSKKKASKKPESANSCPGASLSKNAAPGNVEASLRQTSPTSTNSQEKTNEDVDGGNLDQDNEIEDAIPEETHNEMVEGDHIHIPSSSSSTALSQKELEELKAKDPLEAFKLMLSSRGSSTDKAQGFSTISGNKPSATSKNVLIQELQAKVLNINLFQTIEQDPNITYEIKALLQKLNNPNSGESIVGFILEFEPFLDQVAKDFQKKKDTTTRLDLQGNTRNKEWALVEESRNKTTALETQGKQSKETVAAYDANISKWQKEIKELQSKIEIEERRKAEI